MPGNHDLCHLLLVQGVDPNVVSSVCSAEVSLCSLSELIMLGIAAIASDPKSFGLLVGLSSGSVIAAAIIYTSWVHRQNRAFDGTDNLSTAAERGLE